MSSIILQSFLNIGIADLVRDYWSMHMQLQEIKEANVYVRIYGKRTMLQIIRMEKEILDNCIKQAV